MHDNEGSYPVGILVHLSEKIAQVREFFEELHEEINTKFPSEMPEKIINVAMYTT